MDIAEHDAMSQRRYENLKKAIEGKDMSETKNFFENPMGGNGSNWAGPTAGAFIGSMFGNGGFGGFGANRGNTDPAVTPDQLQTALNGLQGQIQGDALQASIAGLSAEVAGIKCGVDGAVAGAVGALGGAIGGVKDAVVSSHNQTQLSLCNLGHNMTQGFASVNQTIVSQVAGLREQALQQELDNARAKATDLRIELGERKASDLHRDTQISITNQVNSQASQTQRDSAAAAQTQMLGQIANALSALHVAVSKLPTA